MGVGSVLVARITTSKGEKNVTDAISSRHETTLMVSLNICISKSLENLTIHHQAIILSQVKAKVQ